ncbi:MAG: hypothetical protein ABIN39_06575 [candidate division WOR-3 bacterium]
MKNFWFFVLALLLINEKIIAFDSCRKEKQLFFDEKLFKEKLIESIEDLKDKNESFIKNKDVLVEYILCLDIYYKYFEQDGERKKKEYKKLIDYLESLLKESDSPEIYYCLTILYGRYAKTCNIWDAVKMNIPNKIKKYAEIVVEKKPEIDDYGAFLILGRLFYITPKVPYYTNWQSFEKSEIFLKKYIEKNQNSITGKLFLAETYKANKKFDLYDSLINEIVSTTNFDNFQDKKIHDSITGNMK